MIEVKGLTKSYGSKRAVDDVTFTVQPGQVTGFLGPNGAGKSTTMRVIMGLDRPSGGTATVNGVPYASLTSPLTTVGALLDAKAVHPGRSAYHHLLALAATHRIPRSRVAEVIGVTGLESVAGKRVGGFSLGMGQRLGIAAALLGDPEILIFDEPVNGLDPEGVLWVRNLARSLAHEGRTVFLSSHLMSEVALTANRVIIIGRGRVIADGPIEEILDEGSHRTVRVRSPQLSRLTDLLAGPDTTITVQEPGSIEIAGVSAAQIGDLAASQGIALHELVEVHSSLEDVYMELTQDAVEYRTGSKAATATGAHR